jgi:very-short-patch-repair endonuclease
MKRSLNEWIKLANEKHNYKYDYSHINDIISDRHQKVPIKCKEGHIFYMTIKDHVGTANRKGNGCRKCSSPCSNTQSFIDLSNKKHGNKYDYSKSEYKGQKIKTIITCLKHGDFEQTPGNHYHLGRGCPRCKESKGEIEIRKWLEINNIDFIKEKKFDDCLDIGCLKFDFYLSKLNICIEYDGIHHFKPVCRFGGVLELEKVKVRDSIKDKYCFDNNIKMIRISYLDKENIENILETKINKMYISYEKL